MGRVWSDGGYSSDVTIRLVANGRTYDVAQIGPDSMVLRGDDELPRGHAQLIIIVDGKPRTSDIIVGQSERAPRELTYA
jgi:hypothetical protein